MKRWRKLCLAGGWGIMTIECVLAFAVLRIPPIQSALALGPPTFIVILSTIRARRIDP